MGGKELGAGTHPPSQPPVFRFGVQSKRKADSLDQLGVNNQDGLSSSTAAPDRVLLRGRK